MKLNKTLMMAALMASGLFAGIPLQAQDASNAPAATTPTAPMRRAGGMTLASLSKQLDLTDDQKTQIKPILEDMQKQMTALRADTTLSPTDRRSKMMEIRTGVGTQLKTILTPDQYTKWQKIAAGNRRPAPPVAAPPADAPTNAPAAN